MQSIQDFQELLDKIVRINKDRVDSKNVALASKDIESQILRPIVKEWQGLKRKIKGEMRRNKQISINKLIKKTYEA